MAVRDLVGVLEDGAARNALSGTPENARIALSMTQGSTLKVRLSVVNTGGTPVRFADDVAVAVTMTVKRSASQTEADLTIIGTFVPLDGINRADFSLSATATKFLVPGRYVYAVWLSYNGSRDPVVPPSPFILEPGLQLP